MTARLTALCVTAHSDRPEAETFIGLKNEGIDVHVLCAPNATHYDRLVDAGIAVAPLDIKSGFDRKAIERIREALSQKNTATAPDRSGTVAP